MEPTEDLIERVWPDAYRIAYSVLLDRSEAEDVAQEACARLLDTLHTLKNEAAFSAWFYRLVVNESYGVLRGRPRQGNLDLFEKTLDPPEASVDHLDLRDALERLPVSQRLPVVLHYYYGFSDSETAVILATSYAAVRVRLFSARRTLRKILSNASETEGELVRERSC